MIWTMNSSKWCFYRQKYFFF